MAAWKWAAMIILMYVFVAGLLVPLNTGIIQVTPERAQAGDFVILNITGYNSMFTDTSDTLNAWLRLSGDTVLQAQHVQARDDRTIRASFYIPTVFPFKQQTYPMTIIVSHGKHGTCILPDAVFVSPVAEVDSADMALWTKNQLGPLEQKAGIQYPFRNILAETIRNTYFHVPMWFTMIILFGISAWYSFSYYRSGDPEKDRKSMSFIRVGFLFGILGLITGMLWAKNTWNAYWSWDIKQNMSAIALLIYAALMVMRSSLEDDMQKARLTAGYNMFAFILLIPLLFIVPRMTDSLHPGSGGNPAMGGEDLDHTMRMVFYPAVIGFILLGIWISQLVYRVEKLKGTP